MKLEVIDRSREKLIATYVVPDISMLSFEEWKDFTETVIPLTRLLEVVKNLSSADPVTGEPGSIALSVDFYLPDPLKDAVVKRMTEDQTELDAEQIFTPRLKLSTILLAVVEELSRNHLPNDAYKVRISDER